MGHFNLILDPALSFILEGAPGCCAWLGCRRVIFPRFPLANLDKQDFFATRFIEEKIVSWAEPNHRL